MFGEQFSTERPTLQYAFLFGHLRDGLAIQPLKRHLTPAFICVAARDRR